MGHLGTEEKKIIWSCVHWEKNHSRMLNARERRSLPPPFARIIGVPQPCSLPPHSLLLPSGGMKSCFLRQLKRDIYWRTWSPCLKKKKKALGLSQPFLSFHSLQWIRGNRPTLSLLWILGYSAHFAGPLLGNDPGDNKMG